MPAGSPLGSTPFGQYAVVSAGTSTSGTAVMSLPGVANAGVGDLVFSGPATGALRAVTAAGSGKLAFAGTVASALKAAALAGNGGLVFAATGAMVLRAAAVAGSGALVFAGTAASALPLVSQAAPGRLLFAGSVGQPVSAVTAAGVGALAFMGTEAVSLPPVRTAVNGFTGPAGAVFGAAATALPTPTVAAVGVVNIPTPARVGPAFGVVRKREENRRPRTAAATAAISVSGSARSKLAAVQTASLGTVTPPAVRSSPRIKRVEWAKAPIVSLGRAERPKRSIRPAAKRLEPVWVGNRIPEPEPWQPAKPAKMPDEEEELLLLAF